MTGRQDVLWGSDRRPTHVHVFPSKACLAAAFINKSEPVLTGLRLEQGAGQIWDLLAFWAPVNLSFGLAALV
jgi:hypothetical protein